MMNLYKANTLVDIVCIDYYGDKTEYNLAYDILEYNNLDDFKEAIINTIGNYNYEYFDSIIATSHVKVYGKNYDVIDIIK